MLTRIQVADKPQGNEEDATALLLGCHQRIRHFTEIALRIAQNPRTAASEKAEAASSVLRYFEVALPLHEADENESVYPRLHRRLPAGALAVANEDMVRQHTEIDAVIAELIPMWRSTAKGEAQPSNALLLAKTEHLQSLWDAHLSLEEERVLPAMRKYLTSEDLEAIRCEMRSRREV
jgi:hemerythrin-like domain-containing protein